MAGRKAVISFLRASLLHAVDDARRTASRDDTFRCLRRHPRRRPAERDRAGEAWPPSGQSHHGGGRHRTERPVLHRGPDRRERRVRQRVGGSEHLDLRVGPGSPRERGRAGQDAQAERQPGDAASGRCCRRHGRGIRCRATSVSQSLRAKRLRQCHDGGASQQRRRCGGPPPVHDDARRGREADQVEGPLDVARRVLDDEGAAGGAAHEVDERPDADAVDEAHIGEVQDDRPVAPGGYLGVLRCGMEIDVTAEDVVPRGFAWYDLELRVGHGTRCTHAGYFYAWTGLYDPNAAQNAPKSPFTAWCGPPENSSVSSGSEKMAMPVSSNTTPLPGTVNRSYGPRCVYVWTDPSAL